MMRQAAQGGGHEDAGIMIARGSFEYRLLITAYREEAGMAAIRRF
jgi:hypothetical protein